MLKKPSKKNNFISFDEEDYFKSLNNSQLSAERSKSPLNNKTKKLNMNIMPCAPVVSSKDHRRS